jgi:hypothetical protein
VQRKIESQHWYRVSVLFETVSQRNWHMSQACRNSSSDSMGSIQSGKLFSSKGARRDDTGVLIKAARSHRRNESVEAVNEARSAALCRPNASWVRLRCDVPHRFGAVVPAPDASAF